MKPIHLTRTEFDALPEPAHAPKAKNGLRWKHLYRGVWFVAEYVEVTKDVLGIEFREVVIKEGVVKL